MIESKRADQKQRAPQATQLPLLGASCWLAVVFVLAKAVSGDIPWLPHFPARLLTLVACSWADVLFALSCGAIAELALLLTRRSARGRAVVTTSVLALFTVFAWYAVAAIGLFHYFNRPLTFDLLGLVGNAAVIRASILERITWPIGIALIAAPALFLVAATIGARRTRGSVALVVAAVWTVAGFALHSFHWQQEELEHLWLSPHVELLRTAAIRLTGGRRPAFPRDFPPAYSDEFRTVGARGDAARRSFVPPPGVTRPRNVIVIVLESVGAKYLQLYGYPTDITPNLAEVAQTGLVFSNIYAQASFTYASFRPINFSVYPGLPWHYALTDNTRPLPKTLASVMRARGWRTGYFTSGDYDWADQRWLLERSGDFETVRGAADLGCPLLSSWGTEDRCAFDYLIKWIDEKPNESFYAVCWTDQTHDPYLASPGAAPIDFFAGKRPKFADDLSRYLNNLHQVDAQLGRLLASLRERGIADDTLAVITGDHGEAFAEPHEQRGHAWSVYDEEARVPLILWNPRLFPVHRVPTVGGHVDVNSTIADVLDVDAPAEWQGHSLFDPAHPRRAYFMAIAGGDVFGVREANWKYIFDVTSGRESLFDLATDPDEQIDKAAAEPARCLELRRRLAAWVTFEDAYLWGREN